MGGHGGLNILPQKRWHVYNFENREKVRRDEEKAAEEEQLENEKRIQRDAEFRRQVLLDRAKKRRIDSVEGADSVSIMTSGANNILRSSKSEVDNTTASAPKITQFPTSSTISPSREKASWGTLYASSSNGASTSRHDPKPSGAGRHQKAREISQKDLELPSSSKSSDSPSEKALHAARSKNENIGTEKDEETTANLLSVKTVSIDEGHFSLFPDGFDTVFNAPEVSEKSKYKSKKEEKREKDKPLNIKDRDETHSLAYGAKLVPWYASGSKESVPETPGSCKSGSLNPYERQINGSGCTETTFHSLSGSGARSGKKSIEDLRRERLEREKFEKERQMKVIAAAGDDSFLCIRYRKQLGEEEERFGRSRGRKSRYSTGYGHGF